jgi:hypothetical protein
MQALDRIVANAAWRPRARRVHQSFQAVLGEASAPGRHRLAADAQDLSHPEVGRAGFGTSQHDADALGQCLANATPTQQALQLGPLRLSQFQHHSLGPAGHDAPPNRGAASYSSSPRKL